MLPGSSQYKNISPHLYYQVPHDIKHKSIPMLPGSSQYKPIPMGLINYLPLPPFNYFLIIVIIILPQLSPTLSYRIQNMIQGDAE